MLRVINPLFDISRVDTRLADLAASFPALLFALAVPRPGFDPEPAIQATIDGMSLKSLGVGANLPPWLRRLGPEAFARPLGELPNEPSFRRRIVNHIPRSPKLAPTWLQAVEDAALWGHDEIALWIAREITRDARSVKSERLRLVCVWACFLRRKEQSVDRLLKNYGRRRCDLRRLTRRLKNGAPTYA